MELEGQIRQLQQMLQQQKEAEEELVARIGKLQEEKRELQDRLANLQRGLAGAEQEKRELERAHVRLEKDKKALRNTLDKVRVKEVKQNHCHLVRSSKRLTTGGNAALFWLRKNL